MSFLAFLLSDRLSKTLINCIELIGLNLLRGGFSILQGIDLSRNQQLQCIYLTPRLAASNPGKRLIRERDRLGRLLIALS